VMRVGMWTIASLAIAVFFAVAAPAAESLAQTEVSNPSARELIVATKESPPFAIKDADGAWRGISIDLWRRIADQLSLRYRLTEQPTAQALIDGAADGSFDVAISALTVTAAREKRLDFTEPYYSTGLGVAVRRNESRLKSITGLLLSFDFFQAVLALLGIAITVGFVVWMLERRQTDHFKGGAKGLGTGIWWSALAMVHANTSENAPGTLIGRVVAVCWMIASIITIAIFTAGLTSTLTGRELKGLVQSTTDLRSVRVGALVGSSTVDYLDRERISHRSFASMQEALKVLQGGAVDAVVYDKPLLTWQVRRDFSDSLRVLDIALDSQNYGIALPYGSPLRTKINRELLDQIESDWWRDTLFHYLGESSEH